MLSSPSEQASRPNWAAASQTLCHRKWRSGWRQVAMVVDKVTGTCKYHALKQGIAKEHVSLRTPTKRHLVSTITTRRRHSAASIRDTSRSTVVLPEPGLPSSRMDLPLLARSAMRAALPGTARPTRQVRPTMPPSRLRQAADAVQRAVDARSVVFAKLAHLERERQSMQQADCEDGHMSSLHGTDLCAVSCHGRCQWWRAASGTSVLCAHASQSATACCNEEQQCCRATAACALQSR